MQFFGTHEAGERFEAVIDGLIHLHALTHDRVSRTLWIQIHQVIAGYGIDNDDLPQVVLPHIINLNNIALQKTKPRKMAVTRIKTDTCKENTQSNLFALTLQQSET